MKKTILFTAAAIFISTALYSQQPAGQNDITSIARTLAKQIPEINGKFDVKLSAANTCPKDWSEEQKKNYLSYSAKYMDEYGTEENKKLQMYRYERPRLATDLVVIIYSTDYYYPAIFKWFACDRKTGALTESKEPLNYFDKKVYDAFGGWRYECSIRGDGTIEIEAAPSMSETNHAIISWDKTKGNFTFKRKSRGLYYGSDGEDFVEDNAEMEKYVQNVLRPNFQRINAVKSWAQVRKKNLSGSGYVGEDDWLSDAGLTCYYSKEGLEKAVLKIPKKATYEYYFLNKSLSFVYYAAYDKAGAVATERRWYLKNGCFRGIGDKGKKLTPAQIEEDDEDSPYIKIYKYIFRAMDDLDN